MRGLSVMTDRKATGSYPPDDTPCPPITSTHGHNCAPARRGGAGPWRHASCSTTRARCCPNAAPTRQRVDRARRFGYCARPGGGKPVMLALPVYRAMGVGVAVGVSGNPVLRGSRHRPAPPAPPVRVRAATCSEGGGPPRGHRQARDVSHVSALLRYPPARGQPRHPHRSGAPRSPGRQHDPDLHARPQSGTRRRAEPGRPAARPVKVGRGRLVARRAASDSPGPANAEGRGAT